MIVMYLDENREGICYIDFTSVVEEEMVKVKRISRIDKFHQRYSNYG
ncbi:MAG: hypothetical protein PUB18_00630 [bacterium]|nr:hypothetical protein [bacterium]